MKIFIIQPVRNISEEMKQELVAYVTELESEGHEVYLPMKDTDQNDPIGYKICDANKLAIKSCDEVHIAWDGKSQGCLFDLGIAFAFNKRIKTIKNFLPEITGEKSFQKFIKHIETIENES
jgi:hypothetical protein